ncbi:MAG: hypothetical protein E4G99_07400 [Anaerolineales bacterium]|nr:MAG: hypothetical protein E4G99_07400 [Anaerolineales bacterium]
MAQTASDNDGNLITGFKCTQRGTTTPEHNQKAPADARAKSKPPALAELCVKSIIVLVLFRKVGEMKKLIFMLALLLLCACGPSDVEIANMFAVTESAKPTQTARIVENTVEVDVTVEVTVEVTRIKVVTVTNTPTPVFTSTITLTPTQTPIPSNTPWPSPTLHPLAKSKDDGWYVVNEDILPGLWRSTAGYDSCYWATYNSNGDINANNYGDSGGVVRIRATDFQVEFSDCGRWTYQGP